MTALFIGLGLFFVIEGLVYALAPSLLRAAASRLPDVSDTQMRMMGVISLAIGVGIVWLVRG
ncbi:DUF2065 domain-containing protein [Pararhizobium mangrovi]|uniref:DUF2065 domain-containing protein n=1 Tax=Pararhizobium mangrovi TaxID=2590452 RepID=A0A506UHW7_9HYPH|nr:DUF2065 domain-containing protein [Pararhizobium mangrovi]TPW32907.1 DUF2065 domain-containing protein [Pararhizobium mangrovi]